MDDLEISKFIGVGCVALLSFVGLSQVANGVVGMHSLEEPAYAIEIPETGEGGEEDAGPPLHQIVADADAEAGAKVFKKCQACHNVEQGGANGTGPALYGVMGRQIASVDGFNYSGALSGKEGEWNWETLNGFLEKPSSWAPGTSMGFGGLKKPQDRANVMAYLNQNGSEPLDRPAPPEGGGEGGGEAESSGGEGGSESGGESKEG